MDNISVFLASRLFDVSVNRIVFEGQGALLLTDQFGQQIPDQWAGSQPG